MAAYGETCSYRIGWLRSPDAAAEVVDKEDEEGDVGAKYWR